MSEQIEPPAAGVVQLLAALAAGELVAFDQLAEDARRAPTVEGRAALSGMAAVEIRHYERLVERLASLGVAADGAVRPFVEPLLRFHERTRPATWLEGLIKAYIGDGLAADFYREVAEFVDAATRALISDVLADAGSAAFAIREVSEALEREPALRGRSTLWGRRLLGEAIAQTQAVLAANDQLTVLFVSGVGGLAGVQALMDRISERHSARMQELGLAGLPAPQ